MFHAPAYPRVVRIKLIITHDPKANAIPIIARYKVCLPLVAKPGFPAEIKIIIPPTINIKVAKGATIIVIKKLKILPSITKKFEIVQLQVNPHGTKPVALGSPATEQGGIGGGVSSIAPSAYIITIGKNSKNNTINKIIFFMFFLCPRQDLNLE